MLHNKRIWSVSSVATAEELSTVIATLVRRHMMWFATSFQSFDTVTTVTGLCILLNALCWLLNRPCTTEETSNSMLKS